MKITRLKLRQLIKEMSDPPEVEDVTDHLETIRGLLAGGPPSLENLNYAHSLADSAELDMTKFREIAFPFFKKAIDNLGPVSVDDVRSIHEMGNLFGYDLNQMKPIMSTVILKSVKSYKKPTLQDIVDLHNLAKSMNLDLDQLNSIVVRMTQRANVLEQISVDNIIYEIDDILFRVRSIGLQSLGLESVDSLYETGQLSEDQVYETDTELIYSVKSRALEAIERSIAQVILGLLK